MQHRTWAWRLQGPAPRHAGASSLRQTPPRLRLRRPPPSPEDVSCVSRESSVGSYVSFTRALLELFQPPVRIDGAETPLVGRYRLSSLDTVDSDLLLPGTVEP